MSGVGSFRSVQAVVRALVASHNAIESSLAATLLHPRQLAADDGRGTRRTRQLVEENNYFSPFGPLDLGFPGLCPTTVV